MQLFMLRTPDHLLTPSGYGPHRLVVRTSRCGRDNPGSTPGEDISSTGDSHAIFTLACLPGPRTLFVFGVFYVCSDSLGAGAVGVVVVGGSGGAVVVVDGVVAGGVVVIVGGVVLIDSVGFVVVGVGVIVDGVEDADEDGDAKDADEDDDDAIVNHIGSLLKSYVASATLYSLEY